MIVRTRINSDKKLQEMQLEKKNMYETGKEKKKDNGTYTAHKASKLAKNERASGSFGFNDTKGRKGRKMAVQDIGV
uniref:Uncharacterized protein n=1 Tax=Romanomermis culicivorax TaxID=13658 RepID=A0A915K8W6_ROMCU